MSRKYLIGIGLLILSGVFFLFYPTLGSAKDSSLPVLNTKAKNIAVFKNGLGFFMREGTVRLSDGWAVTEYVPNASLGSLWIGSFDKDTILEEVIGFKEDVQRSFEAITIEELLASNIGKKVKVSYGDKIVEGTIKSVPDPREPEKGPGARIDTRNVYDPHIQPKLAAIMILDTGDGEVVLNKGNISKVEFPKGFSASYLSKEKAKRIRFKVATSKKEAKLGLSYLQKGISWVPSYLINIEESKKARITMQATLINDAEGIENVDFFFVVGYPNFLYADVLSPMALEESITQFIQGLRREGRQEDAGGMMAITRQRADFRESGTLSNLDYGYETIKGLPGAAEEDLFLYHKEKISIKKGERAYYPIFFDEVDYKHIYEWEIPDTINVDPRGYQRAEQEKKEKEHVWHSVKLSNSTKYPWTTAPAFVVSGWRPLAQDTLNYTPKNAKTNLRLTVATDVKHERHEYEIDRQRDVKIYNHNYDLVTVKGELSIKNHKNKEITMEIKKRLTGEATEVSQQGKMEKVAEGLRGVNQNSSIAWEILLKAGEEINVTYKYKVYITR
jgi:hypothetical protein